MFIYRKDNQIKDISTISVFSHQFHTDLTIYLCT